MGRARTPFAYLVVPRGCRAVLTGPEPIKLCLPSRGTPQPGGPLPQSQSHVACARQSRTMLLWAVIPISNCRSQKTLMQVTR